jgi:hypothetical protein
MVGLDWTAACPPIMPYSTNVRNIENAFQVDRDLSETSTWEVTFFAFDSFDYAKGCRMELDARTNARTARLF